MMNRAKAKNMKFSNHITVSSAVSGVLYIMYESWGMTISSLLTGILLDVDHYMDYLIDRGSPFNVKKFFNSIYEETLKKIYLVFHGWEWSFVLLALGWYSGWNHWITGIMIGYAHHIVLDALFNTHWPVLGYSFFWRWKRNFVSESIRPRKSEIYRTTK